MRVPFKIFASLLIALLSVQLSAQEMVLLNDTIEWTMSSTHGYYFFQPPSSSPSNWLTPYDYYNGEFYTRYEIISEATDEPCGLQVGIWQYRLQSSINEGEKNYSEIMAEIIRLEGPGSTETNHSSPHTWWRSYEGVDFARVNDFWRLGINIWSLDPRSVIANDNWGGDNDLWAQRSKWFPIRVYVIVVAVAESHSFSGWDHYTVAVPPKPDYTIDFENETTNEIVPPNDEYSTSYDMTNPVSGTDVRVPLTPGQDLYLRTKAVDEIPASEIQHLVVPVRPPKPEFTYDDVNQRTAQIITSEYEYSTDSEMSGAISGSGTYVNFPIGTSLYFRKKATSTAFRSQVQTLTGTSLLPPDYEIDFLNERISTPVSANDEYSYDNFATAGISGTGEYLQLHPGQDVFIRTKADGSNPASEIQILTVPPRSPAPVFEIDFLTETLSTAVATAIEFMKNSESVWISGTGDVQGITPGDEITFREKATSSSFCSDEFLLIVPERPEMPGYTIDYSTEKTATEVPETIVYSDNPDMTGFIAASGLHLQITPGKDIYFMLPATDTSFKSDIQHLDVPSRPAQPGINIDFVNETTSAVVSENIEYSSSPAYINAQSGNNLPLPLPAGSIFYFRVKHTGSSFRSLTQMLEVPVRPVLSGPVSGDTVTEDSFKVFAIFQRSVTGFDLASLEVTNGELSNLQDEYIFDFNVTASNSWVSVRIPANTVNEGNYESEVYSKYFDGVVQSTNEIQNPDYSIFPNPFDDMLTLRSTGKGAGSVRITLLDITGKVVFQSIQEWQNTIHLNLSSIKKGIYLISVETSAGISTDMIYKAE